MYSNPLEDELKNKEYYRRLQGVAAQQATTPVDCCQEQSNCLRPRTTAESVMYNLSEQMYRSTVEGEKAKRILEILTQHPEFHEFLEVLRSGLV